MNRHQKTILIVDDEEFVVKALAKKIKDAGYEVLVQRNGEEGLHEAFEKHPDLILLDIIMPKMDGMTFLDKLREDEWGKSARVIILTNLDSGEEAQKSREKGVTDYLVKTNWSLKDVLSKVEKMLEE